jgi:hypothetical protein
LSDFVAPVVTAAGISGATAYLVARTTARSTIRGASIGADVEREKLAQTRREKALAYVLALNEQMEIVSNRDIVGTLRHTAARQAHTSLLAVHLTLRDDAAENPRVDELLEALRVVDLERAVGIWMAVRAHINSGKLR